MRGILNSDFNFLGVTNSELEDETVNIDQDDVFSFEKGDEVEILRVIKDELFISKYAYVVFNPKNNESVTLDSMFVDLIED